MLRNQQGVTLTESGKLFFTKAKKILNDLLVAQEDIKSLTDEPSGNVKIFLSPKLLSLISMKLYKHMNTKYPKINLQFEEGFGLRGSNLIENGEIDIGVLPDWKFNKNINSQLIISDNLYFYGKKDLINNTNKPIKFSELINYPLILTGAQVILRQKLNNLSNKLNKRLQIIISSDSQTYTESFINEGLAYSIGPAEASYKERKNNRIKIDAEIKTYKTQNYQLYFQFNKANYIKFLESDKKNTNPERCGFCAMCEWSDVCDKIWLEKDHLNQIAKIRKDQIIKINDHGIKTLSQFVKLKKTEKIKMTKATAKTVLVIKFFLSFESTGGSTGLPIQLEAKVNEYLSLIMKLIFAFGISFQLPVILSLLARIGIIDSEYLRHRRKYFVVIIFAMAAILTPPDPITQIGLALPLLLLYELSIFTVKFIEKKEDA